MYHLAKYLTFYIFSTECIYRFHILLRINSDCFHNLHWAADLCNGDAFCFHWGRKIVKYRASPNYERPTYEHTHLRTGGRRALTRTCKQLFTLRTGVSPRGRQVSSIEQTTYERKFGTQPVRKFGTPCTIQMSFVLQNNPRQFGQ
jgi:hypothetical protein